jgi:primary-amine oxidase
VISTARCASFLALALVCTGWLTPGVGLGNAGAAPMHPLDPLTAEEFAIVGDVLVHSGRFSAGTRFAWIELDEPPKALVEHFAGGPFPRRARGAALDFVRGKSFAVVVDVAARNLVSVEDLGRLQPGLTDRDFERGREILDSDPRVKTALTEHGLEIPGAVSDAVGELFIGVGEDPGLKEETGRLVRVLFISDQDSLNSFGPILDSVAAVVDVFGGRVIRLYSVPGVPLRKVPHDLFDPAVRGHAAQPKPVVPIQQQGRNFSIQANVIRWMNWEMRFGFNDREGLVLYQMRFDERGAKRSILYRASVSEVVSRYGDPTRAWPWLELFDEGNFGLGVSSVPVRPGREVPANAVTFDVPLFDPGAQNFGRDFANRIYAYERDAGLLMYYGQKEATIQARSTELVVGFLAQVGNYAYGLRWIFSEDGSFAFEAELAGEVLTKLVGVEQCRSCRPPAQSETPETNVHPADDRYGTLLYPHLVGVYHQHWFNLRLDFDIDGTTNGVTENNVQLSADVEHSGAATGPFFTVAHQQLQEARQAKRDADDATARTWTVFNPTSRNPTGRPPGYSIVPVGNTATIFPRDRASGIAAFTFHHFWATPYRDGVLYADGGYPNQPPTDYSDTLHHYAGDQPIHDTDIVVWYSLGETHVVRPEDYPLMSNARLSVRFVPDGFFERNPALGLAVEHGNPR